MSQRLRLLLPIPYLVLGAFIAVLFVVAAEPERPADGGGAFDPIAFFEDASRSEGSITTFAVNTRDFTADFSGTVEDGRLALEERFRFLEGEPLQRWVLRREGEAISGTVETEMEDGTLAAPVPVEGSLDAEGATLTYTGYAPGGSTTEFAFRHRMRANEDGTVSNHVTVSKFGIPIAVSHVTFSKAGPDTAAAQGISQGAERR